MTNSIREVPLSEGFLVIGSNTTENHPVIGSMIMKEVINQGKKLIVVDPREIELSRYADYYFQIKPGTNIAILNGFMHVLIKEGIFNKEYVEKRCEGFEAMAKILEKYTPKFVAEICGIDNPEDIVKAARLMVQLKPMALYYAMGITQFVSGVNGVKSTANLQMLLGNLGVPGGGVNPLRDRIMCKAHATWARLMRFIPHINRLQVRRIKQSLKRHGVFQDCLPNRVLP
jgi:Uncharacterized anaerobic dehydrogenase